MPEIIIPFLGLEFLPNQKGRTFQLRDGRMEDLEKRRNRKSEGGETLLSFMNECNNRQSKEPEVRREVDGCR